MPGLNNNREGVIASSPIAGTVVSWDEKVTAIARTIRELRDARIHPQDVLLIGIPFEIDPNRNVSEESGSVEVSPVNAEFEVTEFKVKEARSTFRAAAEPQLIELAGTPEQYDFEHFRRLVQNSYLDINARDSENMTALARACSAGNPKKVELLLKQQSINPHLPVGRSGTTALDIARNGRTAAHKMIVKMLKDHSKKPGIIQRLAAKASKLSCMNVPVLSPRKPPAFREPRTRVVGWERSL